MKYGLSLALLALVLLTASCALAAPAESKGGLVQGCASCLFVVPTGQVMNSGYTIPARGWMRLLVIPAIFDALKAYDGETAEEYLNLTGSITKNPGKGTGGIAPACLSCCIPMAGVPLGQVMNSTGNTNLPIRPLVRLVTGNIGGLLDGVMAYDGETLQSYSEIK
jgi:hypothetical protein